MLPHTARCKWAMEINKHAPSIPRLVGINRVYPALRPGPGFFFRAGFSSTVSTPELSLDQLS